jgi:MoxR-like ATPase
MTRSMKVKVSVSIDAEVLGLVDRSAANEGATRSAVMERWLRQAAYQTKVVRLAEDTAAYYNALSAADRQDDADWAAISSRAARSLQIDGPSPAATPRRPHRRRRG